MRIIFCFFIFFVSIIYPRHSIADSCLKSLIPGFRDGCLIECELYYKKNPNARPKNISRTCQNVAENIAQSLNPIFTYSQGMECLKGTLPAVMEIPDQIRFYKKLIQKFTNDYLEYKNLHDEFIEKCNTQIECKMELGREVYKYHLKKPDGTYVIPDAELEQVVKNKSANELWQIASFNKEEFKHACLKLIVNIDKKLKNQTKTDEYENIKFQELKKANPDCPWALDLDENLPLKSKTSGAGQSWLATLGINLQCYEPEKKEQLICYEIAAQVLDPLILLGGGGLTAKVIAKAGVKSVAEKVALKKEIETLTEPSLNVLKENLAKARGTGSEAYLLEKARIAEAYTKFRSSAPRINYETQLNRLFSNMSSQEINAVQDVLKNKYTLTSKGDSRLLWSRFGGGYDVEKKEIITVVPEIFKGTDVEYFIKTHETFHLANAITRSSKVGELSKKAMSKIMQDAKYRYLDEAGAMAQEWRYIDSIPKEIRTKIVAEIKSSKDLSKDNKTFLIRQFDSKAKTPSGHVLEEHKAGRYNKADFVQELKINKTEDAVAYASTGAGGFILSAMHCYDLKQENSTESYFSKYVCENHPLFKIKK